MSDYTIKTLYTAKPAENMNNVTVNGWVRTMRESKTFAFVELNDGTYFKNLQIILDEAALPDYRALVKAITVGASLTVTGTLVMTPEIVGLSDPAYPLQKKRHTLEYMRTIAHLRPRANLFQCAYRIRSIAAQAVHRFFHDRGFVYVKESERLIEDAKDLIVRCAAQSWKSSRGDLSVMKTKVREALNEYMYGKTKRSPMVLPVIMGI